MLEQLEVPDFFIFILEILIFYILNILEFLIFI